MWRVLCLRPSGTSTTASVLYVTFNVSDPAVRQQRQVCCMWRCVMSQTQRYVNNGKCAVCDVVLCLRPSGTSTTASVLYVTLCYVSDPVVRQQRQVCCMWRVMSQTQRYVNNGKCAVCDVVLCLRPSGTSTTASVLYVTCYVSDPAVRQQRQVCCMWRCVMSQTQRYVNNGKCAVCDVVLCLRPSGTSTTASVLYVTLCYVSDPAVRQQRQVCCMWRCVMSQTQRYVNNGKCAVCDVLCLRPSGTSTTASVLYVTLCYVSDPAVRQQRQVCCMWRCVMSQTQRYVNNGKCAVCDVVLCLRPSGTSTKASVLYVTCYVSDPAVRQQRQVCCMWRVMSQTQRYVNNGKCAVCDVVLCLRPSGTSTTASVLYVTCYVSDPAVRQQRQVCCMWRVLCLRPSGTSTTASVLYVTLCYVSDPAVRQQRQVCCMWRCVMSQTQRYVNNGKCAVCDVVLCLRPSGTSTTASVVYVTLCYVSDPAVRQQRQVCCMWRCVMSQTQRYVNNGKCAVCDVVLCYVSDPAVRQQRQVCCMWRCVMSQTQRYVNKGKCAVCDVLCLRPSGTSTKASVLYVTCYVSDPAVRQQRQVCCMWRCVMSQTQRYVNNGKCAVCDVLCLRPSGTSTKASVVYVTCYVSDPAVRQQRQVCCMWRCVMSQTQRYVNNGKCAVCDVLCLRPSGTSTKASVLYVTCYVSDPAVRQQRQVCCMWRVMSQTQRYVNNGKCAVCDVVLCLRPSGTSTTASVLYVTLCYVSDPAVRQQRQVCCMWRCVMSQTQRYVNNGKCAVCDVVLCLRPSGTSTTASVLYVTLCYVSDPAVRQQRQVCCMWRCVMSQTQRYVNNGKCAVCDVVLCLRPSGTSTTASVLYVTLCYVSDPAVRQQRQVCCMWRCVMSQTQRYVNNGKCAVCDVVLCLRPSDTSTTASVLYVTLCYVSDPVVRQQRRVCCMWRCVMSQTQRYVNNGKCAVCDVLCLRPSGTSTTASVVYVATLGANPRPVTMRLVGVMAKASSRAPTHLDR